MRPSPLRLAAGVSFALLSYAAFLLPLSYFDRRTSLVAGASFYLGALLIADHYTRRYGGFSLPRRVLSSWRELGTFLAFFRDLRDLLFPHNKRPWRALVFPVLDDAALCRDRFSSGRMGILHPYACRVLSGGEGASRSLLSLLCSCASLEPCVLSRAARYRARVPVCSCSHGAPQHRSLYEFPLHGQ